MCGSMPMPLAGASQAAQRVFRSRAAAALLRVSRGTTESWSCWFSAHSRCGSVRMFSRSEEGSNASFSLRCSCVRVRSSPSDQLVDELWAGLPRVGRAHARGVRLEASTAAERSRAGVRATGNGLHARSRPRHARRLEFVGTVGRRLIARPPTATRARRRATRRQALALWRGYALADVEPRTIGSRQADRLEELRLQTLSCASTRSSRSAATSRPLASSSRSSLRIRTASASRSAHDRALPLGAGTRRLSRPTNRPGAASITTSGSSQARTCSSSRRRSFARNRRSGLRRLCPRPHVSCLVGIRRRRTRRLAGLVAAGAAVAAVMALTAAGGARQLEVASGVPSKRVALVVQSIPAAERYDEWRRNELVNALDGLRQPADTDRRSSRSTLCWHRRMPNGSRPSRRGAVRSRPVRDEC